MRIQGGRITDETGRTLLLRGCNLGGDSKYPALPDGATHLPEGLRDPAAVSFVGRPFPSEAADEHFARLRSWGFLFLRFIITWEAVEHSGPGIYDESYLAYVRKILKKAEEYGISVFMDCHQDVWSRWTGGDGAPAWTLEKLGIDIGRMDASGAAVTQQTMGAAYPRMIWATNYNRYAAATMFTLFFAGNEYAPGVLIDGEGAQDYLQSKYIAAMRHAYRRLKDCRAIVGWGPMNEPHAGFIGYADLAGLENCALPLGVMPTAFQSMAAASGYPQTAPQYALGLVGVKQTGEAELNGGKVSLFRDGFDCPWKRAGVWTDEGGTPKLLRPGHFALFDGRPVNFAGDFLKPFLKRFAAVLREVHPEALMFIEGAPHLSHPSWSAEDGEGFVNAFHWYDGATLVSKRYMPYFSVRADTRRPVFGRKAVARSFSEQLSAGVQWSADQMGGMPSLLGEFGLPFDMNNKKAYQSGDFGRHEDALSSYYDAVDENLLHSTIWNYTASNSNETGDGWNGEDLSIWSRDGGGPRAIDGWRRPYPIATAGTPVSLRWDRKARRLEYRFRVDPAIDAPTEIYAPAACFGGEPRIRVSPQNAATVEVDAAASRVKIRFASYEGEAAVIIEKM